MKAKSLQTIFIFASLIFLSSCTSFRRYQSVVSHDKKIERDLTQAGSKEDDLPVKMYVSNVKVETKPDPDTFKSLWDLKDRGQQELIAKLDSRNAGAGNTENFIKQLNTKYMNADEESNSIKYYTKIKATFTFTITRQHLYDQINGLAGKFSPADRVEFINYSISPDKIAGVYPFKFTNWNKYTTEYGSIDVGDISFDRTLGFSAGINANQDKGSEVTSDVSKVTTGMSFTPSVSGTGSFERKESQHLKYQFVKLNGRISNHHLSLESEGTREVDLSGNVSADVSIEFMETPRKIYSFKKLKTGTGAYNDFSAVEYKESYALVPNIAATDDINATLIYDYAYRHVTLGRRTFYEWDDRVKYYTGRITKSILLMKGSDALPDLYRIADQSGATTHYLQLTTSGGADVELLFADFQSAKDFLNWLINFPATTAGATITFGTNSLTLNRVSMSKTAINGLSSTLLVSPAY